jgi:hypothetical protein
MDDTIRSDLMIETVTELAAEDRAHRPLPAAGLPTLRSVLVDKASMPDQALFLGLAEDGLPVLLDLHDPIPGPILITGDQTSGKTLLLQMIARAAEYLHTASEVRYGVITAHPDEWAQFQENKTNAGIYSAHSDSTRELLQSLVTWAHNNKGDQQSILLLIDDLEEALKLEDQAEQDLRWLLLRGTSRRVWPIVTLNAGRAGEITEWMSFFRTRLFGRIHQPGDTQIVTGLPDVPLNHLIAGSQFAMREGNNWLNFWVPTID